MEQKAILSRLNTFANETSSKRYENPFLIWKEGMDYDSSCKFLESSSKFKIAARAFFNLAHYEQELAKACYEYSTLMDAFEKVEIGRDQISKSEFDGGLDSFRQSSEIFRSTVHFGYLAPFTSACASAEVTDMMDKTDPERLQGYRNAIALFEQSKIALGFQDEEHPTMSLIDAYIRYCIAQALLLESLQLKREKETLSESIEKERRARIVREEFERLTKRSGINSYRLKFLPLNDYIRATEGAFITSYPDSSGLSLLNMGANPLELLSVNNSLLNGIRLEPKKSINISSKELGKGKVRVIYVDLVSQKKFDEGCILVL